MQWENVSTYRPVPVVKNKWGVGVFPPSAYFESFLREVSFKNFVRYVESKTKMYFLTFDPTKFLKGIPRGHNLSSDLN